MRVRREKEEGRLILFLHDMGYNFFTIGKLTVAESNLLNDAYTSRQEEEKKAINSKRKK